jgi:type VI protein secretion system component VasK
MLDPLIAFCTSTGGLVWLLIASDLSIALACFAVPVVLRERREDVPYPWLWTLFVIFIVACGLTHSVHVASAYMGVEYLRLQTILEIITALATLGAAIAFGIVLPRIKPLPSPRQQRQELMRLVAERTKEKDRLIREINHRVGNQIQVLKSMVSVETRKATAPEATAILDRLQEQLNVMAAQHIERSQADYLEVGVGVT